MDCSADLNTRPLNLQPKKDTSMYTMYSCVTSAKNYSAQMFQEMISPLKNQSTYLCPDLLLQEE